MLTALNFLYSKKDTKIDCVTQLLELQKFSFRFSVLGLGGGLFPKFLYNKFPKATIFAVEIDSDVLSIAQKHFELPNLNERFNVVINDAKIFLEEYSLKNENDKFDALFIDLAGPVNEEGLSCPPPQFVTDYLFKKMKLCLKKNGVLAFNLVTRDEKVSAMIKERIKLNFSFVYNITSDENVNEVLICPLSKNKPSLANSKSDEEWLIHHIEEINKLSLIT